MKRLRIVLALIAALFASPALAQNYSATAGSGLTFGAASNAGVLFPYFIPTGATGTVLFSSANPGYVQFQSAQAVSGTFWPYTLGQQLAAASVPVVLTAAQITTLTPPAWSNSNQIGNTSFAATQGTAANLNATVVGTGTFAVQAAESGTWTVQPGNTANTTAWLINGPGTAGSASGGILTVQGVASMTPILATVTGSLTNISGTISLPTGAATAANQVTEYGYLSTIATAVVAAVPALNETAWNTISPYTTGQTNAATANLYGNLYVDLGKNNGTAGTASASVLTVQGVASMTPILANPGTAANWGVQTIGSTTSGQSGALVQGAATTYAPSYTTAQTDPLSVDLAGNLRVTLQASSSKQSGTANTTGTSTTSLIGAVTSERIYVKSFSCANTGSTASLISFQDGSGGTTLWTTIVPAGSGSNLGADAPIFWTTAGNALYFAAGSASTTIYCSAAGYAGN